MSFHPDPEIAAEIEACAREAEAYDMSVGLPPHRWTCDCGASHSRGHFLSIGVHRCLGCGYVGDGGSIVRFDDDDRALLSGTGKNDVSTDPARLGVPVLRCPECGAICDVYRRGTYGEHVDRRLGDGRTHTTTEWDDGLWFATTPEAVAELRDVMVAAMRAKAPTGGYEIAYADAVLRAMGFTDA